MIKCIQNIPIIGFIIKFINFGFSKVMNEELIMSNLDSQKTKAPEIMEGKDYMEKWINGVFELLRINYSLIV